MTSEDALKLLLSKLDECGIPYMITGSFASNIHGLPRATQDADIVIEVEKRNLERFLENLGSAFYWNSEAALDALVREQMFNAVHLETGSKVDRTSRKPRPFSRMDFHDDNLCYILKQAVGLQQQRTLFWPSSNGQRWLVPNGNSTTPLE